MVCLRASVSGGRARFFFPLLPFSTFLVRRLSRGGPSGRAGRMRIGQMSSPSGVMHHWRALVDVVGSDEGHVM
jgi:hypothetical protein